MDWMLMPLRRYFEFHGRSRRMEFWMFQLMNWIVSMVFLAICFSGFPLAEFAAMEEQMASGTVAPEQILGAFGTTFWIGISLAMLWGLFMLIPNIALVVRRLHDRDMSGWWYGGIFLISFVPLLNLLALPGYLFLLVMFFMPGTQGPNRYGPDPKDPGQTGVFE